MRTYCNKTHRTTTKRLTHVVIILFLMMVVCSSCKKDQSIQRSSFVSVKFAEDVYPINMQTINGNYDPVTRTATLQADGYHNEHFNLYLENVRDTGEYKNPSIHNIALSETADNYDFYPDSLVNGHIIISSIDSQSISGTFQVALSSSFNGAQTRVIVGGFEINVLY